MNAKSDLKNLDRHNTKSEDHKITLPNTYQCCGDSTSGILESVDEIELDRQTEVEDM